MDLAIACFLNPSGLSRAAQEYFKLFTGEGFRVIPIWLMDPVPTGVDAVLAADMLSASNRPLMEAPVELFVGLPHGLRIIKKRRALLGSCVFENSLLTAGQIRACLAMDSVLVPSSFCANACLSSGIGRNKIFKVGYPLDFTRWNPDVLPSIPRGHRFKFLFMNSLYERKGLDVLMRAWWSEFTASDPVELHIKSYREDDRSMPAEAMVAMVATRNRIDRKKEAPISYTDNVIQDENLPGFMRSFDCLVSPHRSEGFGMNPWYAMAIGLPVICTDYGGVTDFAKGDTAWLIKINGMSRPSSMETSIFPHLKGISWAEPDVDSLCRNMRACLWDQAARSQRASNALDLVSTEYGKDNVLDQFRVALEKASPGAWEELNWDREINRLASQPSPRHISGEQVSLVEI
jgi:glycosyltransferase involved in cell wall biosynthesis